MKKVDRVRRRKTDKNEVKVQEEENEEEQKLRHNRSIDDERAEKERWNRI